MDERRPSYEELAALVVELGAAVEELRAENRELRTRVAELERQLDRTPATLASRRLGTLRPSASARPRSESARRSSPEVASAGVASREVRQE